MHSRRPAIEPLRVAVSRSHRDARTDALLQRMGPTKPMSLGSSLKFCQLAEGGMDVYPRFGPTSEWDTAAGQCVLEAAGGIVVCGVVLLEPPPQGVVRGRVVIHPSMHSRRHLFDSRKLMRH